MSKVKRKNLVEQMASQTVLYSIFDEDYSVDRIKLRRFANDDGKSWGTWFIDRDDEIDPVPKSITREYLEYILLAMKKADKEYGEGGY